MKKEIAKMWSDALRSGRFEQTTGSLSRTDRNAHCCLGVLCELAVESGADVEITQTTLSTQYDGEVMHLPPAVMQWAGIHTAAGFLISNRDDSRVPSLVSLNDNGMGFGKIADIIDDNWGTM